ncbi:MAG: hypothetical protein C0433_15730 [Cyclobacterium sp.]|nr:hypothetical protein [Cyclobacterium sp.]
MKLSLFIAYFFFILIGAHAQGKDFLLLKRGNNQKSQLRYYPGESITYKSKKLGYFVTDQIVSLDTDYIYLKENILSPSDILEVGIRDKDPRNSTLRNLTALFLGAGGILMTVEAVNSIYQQNQLQIDQGVAITSGILIGTGLVLLPLRYKTFKNTTGYGIQIILMRME